MKQDSQYTYNVILRRIPATIIVLSVFVAVSIQHARHMWHIVICGLPRSTKFFHNAS